eukprot:3263743-Amphidinium_carterae.1
MSVVAASPVFSFVPLCSQSRSAFLPHLGLIEGKNSLGANPFLDAHSHKLVAEPWEQGQRFTGYAATVEWNTDWNQELKKMIG